MRNLNLQYCQQFVTAVQDVKFLLLNPNAQRNQVESNTTASANNDADSVYLVTATKVFSYQPGNDAACELCEQPGIVGAEYLALENEICLATEVGEVLVLNPQTGAISEGNFCDVGIERMAWSPDQEVVVFVTREKKNVVVMTCTFDPISEHSLVTSTATGDPAKGGDEDGVAEPFINVGWGKKETQFHGSAGKVAAKQKTEFRAPVNVEELPQQVDISWRADGAYFAVSFVSPHRGRTFNVFDNEGRVCYSAEPSMGLQPAVAWRPSGNWVAVPQQVLPHKSAVALYEKNGLRHREVVLPFGLERQPVERLHWSPDSDILVLQTRTWPTETPDDASWQLLLYTIGNYHWYHKQTLRFDCEPVASSWDQRLGEEKTLHVLLRDGSYRVYRFHFAVARWSPAGLVAVIDGCKLLLTQFGVAIVPPPMCGRELSLDTPINACCFIKDQGGPPTGDAASSGVTMLRLAILDAKQRMHVFAATASSAKNLLDFRCLAIFSPAASSATAWPLGPLANLQWTSDGRHLLATDDHRLLLIGMPAYGGCCEEDGVPKMLDYCLRTEVVFAATVCALARGNETDQEYSFAQTLSNGRIHRVCVLANASPPSLTILNEIQQSRSPTATASVVDGLEWYAGETATSGARCTTQTLIAHLANGCLQIGGRLVDGEVTSFVVAGNFLAYTKLSVLHFLRLGGQPSGATTPWPAKDAGGGDGRSMPIAEQPTLIASAQRNLERGSKLITSMAGDARLVLQMPRGNLEVITPRLLVLEIIGTLLDAGRYGRAFELLRQQRINLNILCDHNMKAFVAHVDEFLDEVRPAQWLNLFLSELQNEDFTFTMYASNYQRQNNNNGNNKGIKNRNNADNCLDLYPSNFLLSEKVSYLCRLFGERMLERSTAPGRAIEAARFRLPIITALVKVGRVEDALLRVWQQKREEAVVAAAAAGASSESLPAAGSTAEDSLRYLLILVDVGELYKVALGTYDFGLVLYVAQKSQRDPKEFLPLLNELQACEPNYRKYRIDVQLKRHSRALEHIARACEDGTTTTTTGAAKDSSTVEEVRAEELFLEALSHAERHRLYQHALRCFAGQPARHRRLCVAYADQLRADGHLAGASLMYERGGQLTQALASARHVLDWRRVLVLARRGGAAGDFGGKAAATPEQLDTVALSLVPALEQHDRHAEAYELLTAHGRNWLAALQCLVRGGLFLRAIYEVRLQSEDVAADAEEALIRPALLAFRDQLAESLAADEKVFDDHRRRLLEVREKRAKEKQQQYVTEEFAMMSGLEGGGVGDESDLFSETGSLQSSRYTASSRGTGKTHRSSKNRRKHERKLLSLKPGNPFEDCALIDGLHNLIVRLTTAQQQQHVHDTCRALLELCADPLAAELQTQYAALLKRMRATLDDIWTPDIQAGAAAAGQQGDLLRGPNVDYAQLRNEQRYAVLAPLKRFKPELHFIEWEHEILRRE